MPLPPVFNINLCFSLILELHDAFVLFDVNHDGRITEAELNSVLNFLGIKASPTDVKKMIAEADIDGEFFQNFMLFITKYLFCRSPGDGL